VSIAMSENPFDFDKNPHLPTNDYDIAVRQSIPGYDAMLDMLTALFQIYLTADACILFASSVV
jgi:tRNA (cmo5U34)-methyltransferase